jgi:hypothetical protein
MKEVKKKIVPLVDISALNEDQKNAFNELKNYICDKNNDDIYVLKGWAGTGKTFCVSLLVKYVLEVIYPDKNFHKIAVTGPTNKSVRVIKKSTGIKNPRVTFQTIHKLLGLTEVITNDGKQEFINKGDFRAGIESTRLLIIDEVSMLSDDLFHNIIKYRDKTKIICMGDPAQIPPVGRPDCIPFRDDLLESYGIKTLELKTIMRQKQDNPIINASVLIREDLEKSGNHVDPITILNEKGDGIEFLNLNLKETKIDFTNILSSYFNSEKFKLDPEYAKIIAWRNKTVGTMNSLARKIIYGTSAETSKLLLGEKLIANNPIMDGTDILFNTNDEFIVENFEIKTEKIKTENAQIGRNEIQSENIILKYYETRVSYLNEDDKRIIYYIDILHEDSEEDFYRISNILKRVAIEKKGREKTWIKYYNFLRKFADVNYAYAITAHKAQGSTYNTTFVLEDDIEVNIDVVERNRIKYTAYTRPSNKLYVLKRF